MINGKKYRKSYNLLSYDYLFSDDYAKESTFFIYYRLQLAPNTQYTIKTNYIQYLSEVTLFFGLSNTMSTATDGVTTSVAKTITTGADGIAYIARRIMSEHGQEYVTSYDKLADGTYYIMLNAGNTAIPFEPYGNIWTDVPIPTRKYVNGEWVDISPKQYVNGEWI